ncbi:hypothetical protein AXG93_4620s2180 [Marchantia polymorpha subsp. ruderalis]|uniref:Uncharacterized protein n=1 Tax=Marchantia polymorpha subsp. ruderalis TaxID=1480154 RepID=A0A176VYD1_MARPO|nr:hypothetical protein AXG93_4620s2180 [Marchantia polymorpha subsp. ruderalis]
MPPQSISSVKAEYRNVEKFSPQFDVVDVPGDFESKMEVVKVALKLESAALEKVAVTAGDKSFTYAEVLRSAFNISSILENKDGSNGHVAEGEESAEKQMIKFEAILIDYMTETPSFFSVSPPDVLNFRYRLNIVSIVVVEAEAGKKADGPRIGIMAKPCAEFVAAMWAAWLNGAVAVPLALSYPEAELMHVMTDADISVVVATEEYREILEKVVEKSPGAKLYILPPVVNTHGNEITDTQSLDKLLVEVKNRSLTLSGEEAALIIYTSGTTGRPKGVVHTQAGLGAQVRMLSEAWGYTADDRFLHCLPLHHVHGLINSLLAPLYAGATIDLLPKFSTSGVWQRWRSSYPVSGEVAATPITVFTGVPTIYVRLLQGYETMDAETQKASADAARQLRLMMCGSSALPQPVMDQWESLTGHRLLERYGMTEFGMGLTNPLHGERRPGFVGKPFPGIEIRVDDSDSDVKGVGELLMKSPSMFREYWRQPKVTADNFTEDGYFRTGDTVTIEDGYVKILGRTSVDIIKVGGFKLSALEIEAVLLEHPAIAECAVLGLPDKDYGELMCVVIVPPEAKAAEAAATSEPVLTLKELHKWGADKMAPYKLPQKLLIWESMPRNAMGKVNKKELKKTLLESTS